MEYSREQQREHRRAWSAKLRSGDIPQYSGRMREFLVSSHLASPVVRLGDAMCVLGVGCEVSGLGEWDVVGGCYRVGDELEGYLLPKAVRNYYGLASADGTCNVGTLAGMNDNLKLSFKHLAAVLDFEPDGLLESDPVTILSPSRF